MGGQEIVKAVFKEWHRFREGELTRRGLRRRLAPLRLRLKHLLARHINSSVPGGPQDREGSPGLRRGALTFARIEGVEPTNNAAERAVRKAVLWRKTSFGSASRWGSRFAERMLTVCESLRAQGRSILDFLVASSELGPRVASGRPSCRHDLDRPISHSRRRAHFSTIFSIVVPESRGIRQLKEGPIEDSFASGLSSDVLATLDEVSPRLDMCRRDPAQRQRTGAPRAFRDGRVRRADALRPTPCRRAASRFPTVAVPFAGVRRRTSIRLLFTAVILHLLDYLARRRVSAFDVANRFAGSIYRLFVHRLRARDAARNFATEDLSAVGKVVHF